MSSQVRRANSELFFKISPAAPSPVFPTFSLGVEPTSGRRSWWWPEDAVETADRRPTDAMEMVDGRGRRTRSGAGEMGRRGGSSSMQTRRGRSPPARWCWRMARRGRAALGRGPRPPELTAGVGRGRWRRAHGSPTPREGSGVCFARLPSGRGHCGAPVVVGEEPRVRN
jgi:hypothetical protein